MEFLKRNFILILLIVGTIAFALPLFFKGDDSDNYNSSAVETTNPDNISDNSSDNLTTDNITK